MLSLILFSGNNNVLTAKSISPDYSFFPVEPNGNIIFESPIKLYVGYKISLINALTVDLINFNLIGETFVKAFPPYFIKFS